MQDCWYVHQGRARKHEPQSVAIPPFIPCTLQATQTFINIAWTNTDTWLILASVAANRTHEKQHHYTQLHYREHIAILTFPSPPLFPAPPPASPCMLDTLISIGQLVATGAAVARKGPLPFQAEGKSKPSEALLRWSCHHCVHENRLGTACTLFRVLPLLGLLGVRGGLDTALLLLQV